MRYTRHIVHLGALITSLAACGGERAQNATATGDRGGAGEPRPGVEHTDRVVCPACAPHAGGETSDFGDGSDYFPGGDGSVAEPTPCELSQQASAIDVEAARALGFGAALEAVETTFDLPFEWSPSDAGTLGGGGPAKGFTPETRLRGTTQVSALERRASTLEGCKDVIVATLATQIETADGALAVAGNLRAALSVGDAPHASGMLDLSQAHGTLELDPPSTTATTVGVVLMSVYFLPKGVRTDLSVTELDPEEIGSDEVSFYYQPIGGRAPIDACAAQMEPTDFEEPTAALGGASLSDRFPEVEAKFRIGEAIAARWRDGTETTVQLELGTPHDICVDGATSYRVPFQVTSGDGRVVAGGTANATVSDGMEGWVELFNQVVEPADTFAQLTGIHGVDFGGLGAARWHTEVYSQEQTSYLEPGEAPYHGEVTVEGVDDDGHVTGTPGAVTGVIEKLTW
jgi:hypothetical protein